MKIPYIKNSFLMKTHVQNGPLGPPGYTQLLTEIVGCLILARSKIFYLFVDISLVVLTTQLGAA